MAASDSSWESWGRALGSEDEVIDLIELVRGNGETKTNKSRQWIHLVLTGRCGMQGGMMAFLFTVHTQILVFPLRIHMSLGALGGSMVTSSGAGEEPRWRARSLGRSTSLVCWFEPHRRQFVTGPWRLDKAHHPRLRRSFFRYYR